MIKPEPTSKQIAGEVSDLGKNLRAAWRSLKALRETPEWTSMKEGWKGVQTIIVDQLKETDEDEDPESQTAEDSTPNKSESVHPTADPVSANSPVSIDTDATPDLNDDATRVVSTAVPSVNPVPDPTTNSPKKSVLAVRRYITNEPLVQDSFDGLENYLSSISHSFDARTTILGMKESEEKDELAAQTKYDTEVQLIESKLALSEITSKERTAQIRAAKAILRGELSESKTNWRQTEWAGWHFENLIVNSGESSFGGDGKAYGRSVLDTTIDVGGKRLPLDVKTHSMNDRHGKANCTILLNDQDAVKQCIEDYGVYLILVAKAKCEYDMSGDLKKFHNSIKDRVSTPSLSGRKRVMKEKFDIVEFSIYAVTKETLPNLTEFNQGRQASGHDRNPKYSMFFGKGGFVPIVKFVTEYGVSQGR